MLDPPRNRHCYYRGEKIPVRLEPGPAVIDGALRLSLVRDGKSFPAGECPRPTKETPAQAEIPTADLACGDYRLQVRASSAARKPWFMRRPSRFVRVTKILRSFSVQGATAGNPYRQEMMLKDLIRPA